MEVKAPEVPRAPLPRLEGDLSGDGVVDAIDVDLLFAALASDSTDLQYDLDGDGSVAASDRNYMVLSILDTRSGDVDINGRVDFADFLSLSANFGRQDVGWEDGDFDGDGRVAFSDFLLLSTHFGFDRDGPA